MSPEVIEQLHRIEGKIDSILEFVRLEHDFSPQTLNNKERVCPLCEEIIKYSLNKQGEVVRQCLCSTEKKSLDFNIFGPPKGK